MGAGVEAPGVSSGVARGGVLAMSPPVATPDCREAGAGAPGGGAAAAEATPLTLHFS